MPHTLMLYHLLNTELCFPQKAVATGKTKQDLVVADKSGVIYNDGLGTTSQPF